MTQAPRHCWCGNTRLEPFSPEYLRCAACETLVTAQMPEGDIAAVTDDERDFYGREYWFSHQQDDLGFTDITQRARTDLPERGLHWLAALLKFVTPPGRTLELGSAHGGFVALMQWAGFEATGLELSPWVVDFARRTFDVPMLLGKLEGQQIPPASLDAICLMDVMEHLPDPVGTMKRCLELLKPNGVLLVQTPGYVEGRSHDRMVADRDPFLDQLKANQHLYLFSRTAIRRLFRDLGAGHLSHEPAIFAHYDQFFAVSRTPLVVHDPAAIASALSATSRGRLVLALLDSRERARQLTVEIADLHARLGASEADRAARLAVIERQGAELGRLGALEAQLAASEADRAARLAVIERQGAELGRLADLEARLVASEADRAARLEVIERQGAELGTLRHQLAAVKGALGAGPVAAVGRLVSPARWRAVTAALETTHVPAASAGASRPGEAPAAGPRPAGPPPVDLGAYSAEIDRFNRGQGNADLLDAIRRYNHAMIDELDRSRPLRGKRVLDVGASPHGYALERALQLRAAEYVGIGLDVASRVDVTTPHGTGTLLAMNAEQLEFPDASFDLVFSISTFEHVGDVARVLSEIRRVLRPGGSALASFEPIWTASYGHHLHHFGPVSKLMPDWAHLLWDKPRMLAELAPVWPAGASPSLEEAAHWVYESDALNRVPIGRMRDHFTASGLQIEWMLPIKDEPRDAARLRDVSGRLALSEDDLMTKGLSVLLNKA